MVVDSAFGGFDHVTVTGNVAGVGGGGVYGPGSSPSFAYCNGWGNSPDDYGALADPTGQDGNIGADPGFADTAAPDPRDWDLHLAPASPLVDAGDPGEADPDGGTPDIGALGGTGADGWELDGDGYPLWWQPGAYDPAGYPALGLDCDDRDPAVFPGSGC